MTLQTVVEDLEALRQHLKQDRLVLLGHSWGGMLAMAYAVAHPERVDRLILIGSGGPTLEFAQWFSDNIDARLRPEDIEARSYWQAAVKNGVDRDKAALEETRAIVPGISSIGRKVWRLPERSKTASCTRTSIGCYSPIWRSTTTCGPD